MYALIYQNNHTAEREVISVHASRKDSERNLAKRQKELNKDEWECSTRIVWTDKPVQPGDIVGNKESLVWR